MSIELSATPMHFANIPQNHVAYLRANEAEAIAYLLTDSVKRPAGFLARVLGSASSCSPRPADWPTCEANKIQIDENLGTNAKAMHYFLNGTDAPVEGPGNLFQAWLVGSEGCAERFSGRDGYAFVHNPEQVVALLQLLLALDGTSLSTRWRETNAHLGLSNEESEYEYIAECFSLLIECYRAAAAIGQCVIWAPQQ